MSNEEILELLNGIFEESEVLSTIPLLINFCKVEFKDDATLVHAVHEETGLDVTLEFDQQEAKFFGIKELEEHFALVAEPNPESC